MFGKESMNRQMQQALVGTLATLSAFSFTGCASRSSVIPATPDSISPNSVISKDTVFPFDEVAANPLKYIGYAVEIVDVHTGPGKAGGRFSLHSSEWRTNQDTETVEHFSTFIRRPLSPLQEIVIVVSNQPDPVKNHRINGIWRSDGAERYFIDARTNRASRE